ncbi:MAG: hypothetical protein WBO46_04295, partial [Caldilineaceae bacterium]
TATRQNVLQAIEQARVNSDPFELIWFVAHGGPDGVVLENGTLSGESLTAYVRSGGIGGVVLNTCESIAIANAIVQESGADVVATIQPVPDVTAYETGALLAGQLATGGTLRQAYRQSKPGRNDNYIFLDGLMPDATPRQHQRLNDTDDDALILRQIRKALLGDPYNRNERGLLADFAAMVDGQNAAKVERETISNRVTFLSNVSLVQSIVLFAIVVVLAGMLVYLGQRSQGGLTPEPPAASMQYPHQAAIEGKRTKDEDGDLPVGDDGETEADNRDADGGEQRAVGMAGLVGVFGEPLPVFVPNPQIQQPAEEQA